MSPLAASASATGASARVRTSGSVMERATVSAPAGAPSQRMRRLVAAGLLPERAGQPVKVWLRHEAMAELRAMDDGSVLAGQWITEMAARWAARRAAASQGGGDGGAWLDGTAAGPWPATRSSPRS